MANDNYTKTGQGPLTNWANRFSMIPVLGAPVTLLLGGFGTFVNTAQWLMKGKVLSAFTAFAAGSVSTAVNFGASAAGLFSIGTLANWGSGVTTGKTVGTHARKLTETAIGGLAGLAGQKPTVLRSYQAGIGSIGGASMGAAPAQQQPGYWSNRVAAEQGRDPQQRWQEHVNASRAEAAMAGGRA